MDANYGARSTLGSALHRDVIPGDAMLEAQARASFDFWLAHLDRVAGNVVAEREGFEPSRGLSPLLAFQASAFNRSTTSPRRTMPVAKPLLVAVALVMLLVCVAAAEEPPRHAVAGHYDVAHPRVPNAPRSDSTNSIANPGFESGNIDRGWYNAATSPLTSPQSIRTPAPTTNIRGRPAVRPNRSETPASASA